MIGSAHPMIEAMLHEIHDPHEAARRRPYFTGHRRDLPDYEGRGRQDEPVAIVDRVVAAVAQRVQTLRPRSRPAATSC